MNKYSNLIIVISFIIEIVAIYAFLMRKIETKSFLYTTSVCVLVIIAQKLSINYRNKNNSSKEIE